jgi:hypothetical protein
VRPGKCATQMTKAKRLMNRRVGCVGEASCARPESQHHRRTSQRRN